MHGTLFCYPFLGGILHIFMNCSRATLDVICVSVTRPLVGTPDCSYYVVYMLPALHRPAFTTSGVVRWGG